MYNDKYQQRKQYLMSVYHDTIEFAVYCRPGDSRNFEVFKRVLGQ